MNYDWFLAVSLVKTLFAFALFFVYLPTKIFPQRPDSLLIDRFFENLALTLSTAIVFAHLLVLMQIFNILTLLLCYLMMYAGKIWYQQKVFPFERLKTFVVGKTVLTLDVLDHVVDLKESLKARLKEKLETRKEWTKDRHRLIHLVLFAAVLLYAAALRFADLFRSPAFGYSDPYSHLLWMKILESGDLYPAWGRNQFYPKGFHVFLSILHQLTALDGAVIIRLAGPLVGVLLVLAVYYSGRKLTKNPDAALVGMAIYGTAIELISLLQSKFTEEGWLEVPATTIAHWLTRQSIALPEEFALVFLMPALFAAYGYLTEKSGRSLVLFSLTTLMIFMSHPLIPASLALGLAALGALSLLLGVITWQTLKALTFAGLATAVLGNLQVVYGWLFTDTIREVMEDYTGPWLGGLERGGVPPYTLEVLTSAGAGLLLFSGGILFATGREKKLLWSFLGLYLLLLTFLGRALDFGFHYLIPPDRLENLRIFLLPILLAGLFHAMTLFPIFSQWYRRRRWLYQAATAACLAALAVLGIPSELPQPPRFEHDAAVVVSYEIRRSFPPLEWTVVSTTEDYSKVFKDKGWHINVGEFVEHYDPYDSDILMPTPYTFLFVEKRLLSRSSDPGLNRPGVRLDLERRLLEWSNIYNLLHDDMSVYYEDWDIIVYLVNKNHKPTQVR